MLLLILIILALFDNLQNELDGIIYEQEEPEIFKLSVEQIDWLKKNVNTFQTSEPTQYNEDLKFLKEIDRKSVV
jgi:hypothetical protein